MFAYVFWHQRDSNYSTKSYVEGLTTFHSSLASMGVRGFLGSFSFRVNGAPWLTGEGYEDWYLVAGLGVLEELNSLVEKSNLKAVHDEIAHMSVNGKGTILTPIMGDPTLVNTTKALWFSKPRGTSYADFYKDISSSIRGVTSSVWRRQLALGPTPEFLLLSDSPPSLPEAYLPKQLARDIIVHPPGAGLSTHP
ncbi:MAG: hypothetical protein QW514_07305 [Thermoprotei archaeon]